MPAKGEPLTPLLKSAFNTIINNSSNTSHPHRAIKKLVMKTLGERDYAAQETMHHLLSLKLHSSSFHVIPVSLNGSRRVRTTCSSSINNQEACSNSSFLDIYANRQHYDSSPDITMLNFVQFVKKFKLVNNKLTKLPDNVIPRIFPTYSSNPKGPNYALHCKYQLLRYKPWKLRQDNAWEDEQPSDQIYINKWHEFLQTSYAKANVPDWFDKLQIIVQSQEEANSVSVDVASANTREEWMILADLNTPFNNSSYEQTQLVHDWQEDRSHYTDQQIGEMPTWVTRNKEQSNRIHQQSFEPVDINSFSQMQQLAYSIVKTHFKDTSSNKEPLCLIINGVAGTGKSYLITAIRSLLQSKCVITATTGKASFNIFGVTIHSLLKLPCGSRRNNDLTGQTLIRLQESLNDIDYIVIDEYSMLGQVTFGWVDKRCRQASGITNKIFGGLSVILCGDPAQLPPVADKPLYHNKPSNNLGQQGHLAYKMFDKVVKLTVNHRVKGVSPEQVQFRDLLTRLRKGESTIEDWNLLLLRQPSNFPDVTEYDDATRLFYSNDDVANYNYEQLIKLQQPIAHINAHHSSALAKNISPDELSGLQPSLFLAKNAKVMLTMNLWPSVGLCNGATGIVRHLIFQHDHQPPDLPIAVIVQFDNYRGPSISHGMPSCVPICPCTASTELYDGLHERQQLPLRLAWAITIHKSQGLTLPKAWIDIGKSERTAGVSYVAISRVKTLSSCVIEPMTYQRLTSLKSSANLQYRLEEEHRLDKLAQQTYSAYYSANT